MEETQQWYDRNSTLSTIRERHSIRQFTDEPVTDEMIQIVLKAANQAPSAHNQQSWRFIVIRGEKKRELVELVNRRASGFPKSSSVLLRMASRSIASAPAVIAVANTGDLIEHGTQLFQVEQELAHDFFRTMEIQSSAAAVQNLLLAATSLGLATVWLGILYLLKDEVLTLLGEPKGEFMAVIPIGFPLKEARGPAKRPLEAIVKYLD
ncbi:nitroreductase [Hydrogenispora ethanolica]|uniref:Nitroreductase n=1 Tax=Hydrogenispora ethanolica TaxID=1082276 RepID=A0A4R1R8B0_HYDET|nr:nitroreductase family protein [Hydrogenispora ethanolica]TCL61838.1 nitroreductase [Hydrogenispora ethanolica]